jgi:hypothetical protein
VSRKSEELALRRELVSLRLEAHRLEIATGIATLRNPLRNAAIGASILKLLRTHPIIITGASAMLARMPRLGLIARLGAGALAAWQALKLVRRWRKS